MVRTLMALEHGEQGSVSAVADPAPRTPDEPTADEGLADATCGILAREPRSSRGA